jgi:hypothetical protein
MLLILDDVQQQWQLDPTKEMKIARMSEVDLTKA